MTVSMQELYAAADQRLRQGEAVAVPTVVATRGSTPQKAGAKMLIFADGQIMGTIGGGCVEADVWAETMRLLRQRTSALREFVLADDPDHPGGDVCGGTMEVFIDILHPESTAPSATSA